MGSIVTYGRIRTPPGSNELILDDGVLDLETKASYSVNVRVTDSAGNTYDETLTVNVNDLNEAPTDIGPNSFSVDENTDTSGGYSLGTLSRELTDRFKGKGWSEQIGIPIAAGLIVGEALVGVGHAIGMVWETL